MKPTTCDTAYFGGIEIIMWTWSANRCPSSIRLSFCSASLRNTSPKCLRRLPYDTFLRHFGIKTTWYLHSHFEWLKLSYSSIRILLVRVLGGSRRRVSWMDPLKCQTATSSPAEPGELPIGLDQVVEGRVRGPRLLAESPVTHEGVHYFRAAAPPQELATQKEPLGVRRERQWPFGS